MNIRVTLGTFFSSGDESRFFKGLEDIPAVKHLKGVGTDLIITLNLSRLNREGVRELIAIFRRYGISRKSLKFLAAQKKYAWLREEGWDRVLRNLET